MGFFGQSQRPPRRFTYEPRYDAPGQDGGRRLRIERAGRNRRRKPGTLVRFLLLLAAALYLYLSFG